MQLPENPGVGYSRQLQATIAAQVSTPIGGSSTDQKAKDAWCVCASARACVSSQVAAVVVGIVLCRVSVPRRRVQQPLPRHGRRGAALDGLEALAGDQLLL